MAALPLALLAAVTLAGHILSHSPAEAADFPGQTTANRQTFIKHYTVETDSGPLFPTGGPGCGPGSGAQAYPRQPSAAGRDCDLWFTEFDGRKVGRMTGTGQVTEFPRTGTLPANSSGGWITTGPDGNLWFTLGAFPRPSSSRPPFYGAAIARVTPAGEVTVFPLADESSGPNGIITGPDGNLWFAEFHAQKIGRSTPTGQITEFPLPSGIPQDAGPHEITAGPDGNLWFTIPGANKVARITPSGLVTEFQLPPPPDGTAGALKLPPTRRPASITVGPDSNLWFTQRDINAIGRITLDGGYTSFSLPYNRWSPGLNDDVGEIGVAGGAIWFTEQVSKCVGRITPDGVVNEFADAPAPGTNPASTLTLGPDGDLWFTEMVYQSPSNVIARLNPWPPANARVPCPPPS